jgi:exodeoxyribonuclease V alpha subunit
VQAGPVTIEGTLERIRFASEDDAWSVVVVSLSDTGREVAAVGNFAGVQPGESLHLTGRWTVHPRFGEQLQVDAFSAVAPATLAGIERYLGSGLVKGIGRELASRLVKSFGLKTLDVIDSSPRRLREVEGIGPARSRQITAAWAAQRAIRDVMVFLQSYGVSTALAARIWKLYGTGAVEAIRENPYRLAAEVDGVGFKTADAVAKNLGIPPDSPHRAEAGIRFVLGQAAAEGHTAVPVEEVAEQAAAMLSVEPSACLRAVDSLAARGGLELEDADGRRLASLPSLARAEKGSARLLARLIAAQLSAPPADASVEIAAWEAGRRLSLSPLQREAVARGVKEKVLVITGGPGTGKTTLITCLIDILQSRGRTVLLCAPTGRAAKRMAEATGREAKTIHRLLEFSPAPQAHFLPQNRRFLRGEADPLRCDVLVVDETSMIDVQLFHDLLAALPAGAQLIMVGDQDQLPSVGPGNVLADIIASGVVPVVRLTEIFRQAAASRIVVNAHRINDGLMPETSPSETGDFFIIERDEPEKILETVRELVTRRIPQRFGLDPREDIQVLTPMQKGALGVGNLNAELQALLNPRGPSLTRGSVTFRTGDRVMQMRNDYERGVFNGDIGRIVTVNEAERSAAIRFDERIAPYEWADLDEISLAYACSIHKSQGSEFPAAVVVLHTQHFVLLKRNLLYTAVTRGRRLTVLVGSRKALAIAVKSVGTGERSTRLARRLLSYFP